jgi:hypothetical protein
MDLFYIYIYIFSNKTVSRKKVDPFILNFISILKIILIKNVHYTKIFLNFTIFTYNFVFNI